MMGKAGMRAVTNLRGVSLRAEGLREGTRLTDGEWVESPVEALGGVHLVIHLRAGCCRGPDQRFEKPEITSNSSRLCHSGANWWNVPCRCSSNSSMFLSARSIAPTGSRFPPRGIRRTPGRAR